MACPKLIRGLSRCAPFRNCGNLPNTVGSGLFGPLVDRPSAWYRTLIFASSRTDTDGSSEFHMNSSQVFDVWVVPSRDVVVVLHFITQGQIGYCGDEVADKPVVSIGAKT